MPAAWSPKDERQYGHILTSCRKRGQYGEKRCKHIAAATVNKQRRLEGRTLGEGSWCDIAVPFWHKRPSEATCKRMMQPSLSDLGKRLTAAQRRRLKPKQFCLPEQRKYPVPDCRHADNALSRATAAYREGYLSASQYRRVKACARRVQRRLC